MKLLFSVGKKDLIRQTFASGGPGGQHKNATKNCIRFIHEPSGARAQAVDSRDQSKNEREAFKKLVKTKEFLAWHKVECAKRRGEIIPETKEEILARVDKMIEDGIRDGSIVIENFFTKN